MTDPHLNAVHQRRLGLAPTPLSWSQLAGRLLDDRFTSDCSPASVMSILSLNRLSLLVVATVGLLTTAACATGSAGSGESASHPATQSGDADSSQEASAASQQSAQTWFETGNRRLDNQKYDAAAEAFQRATDQNAEFWQAHLNRGIALSAANDFDGAVQAFEQALVRGGRAQPAVYYNLGNAYQNRGMFDHAIETYRAGLAHCESPHLDMLVNLAGAYALSDNRQAARETYNYIQRLAPDDARAPYGLGIVAYFDSDLQGAIKQFNRAASLDPSFATVYFSRARLHHKLGHHDRARRDYRRYLELATNGPFRHRANRHLSELEQAAQ